MHTWDALRQIEVGDLVGGLSGELVGWLVGWLVGRILSDHRTTTASSTSERVKSLPSWQPPSWRSQLRQPCRDDLYHHHDNHNDGHHDNYLGGHHDNYVYETSLNQPVCISEHCGLWATIAYCGGTSISQWLCWYIYDWVVHWYIHPHHTPDRCQFWYTTALSRPVKSTPKKFVKLQQNSQKLANRSQSRP